LLKMALITNKLILPRPKTKIILTYFDISREYRSTEGYGPVPLTYKVVLSTLCHWQVWHSHRFSLTFIHKCDKVCLWLAAGQWFSLGPLVSSTNRTDRHDITEILLKVALNTIKQTNKQSFIH
jgi:hypothetical protein